MPLNWSVLFPGLKLTRFAPFVCNSLASTRVERRSGARRSCAITALRLRAVGYIAANMTAALAVNGESDIRTSITFFSLERKSVLLHRTRLKDDYGIKRFSLI